MAMNSSGGHPAALRVHPAHQRLQTGDDAVEADLGLVVQLDLAGVQRAPQIGQQAEPVGGVAVARGLVDLDAAYGRAWPRTSPRPRGAAAPRPRGRARGRPRRPRSPPAPGSARPGPAGSRGADDQVAGGALGAGGGVGERAAARRTRRRRAGPPPRRAAAPRRSRSAICNSSLSPARWPRVSLTERKRSRSMRTSAERAPVRSASSSADQVRSSSHWRLGSPVSGSRSCSSARARAIHSVESSAMSGTANSGSSSGRCDGDHGDQRGDAQQRDGDQALPHQRRAQRRWAGRPCAGVARTTAACG